MVNLVDSNLRTVAHDQLGLLLYEGGTVCDHHFDFKAADTICRQIWNSSYTASWWTSGMRFDIQNKTNIKLYDAQCSIDDWKNCIHYQSDYHGNCDHENDVFLKCSIGKIRQSLNLMAQNLSSC